MNYLVLRRGPAGEKIQFPRRRNEDGKEEEVLLLAGSDTSSFSSCICWNIHDLTSGGLAGFSTSSSLAANEIPNQIPFISSQSLNQFHSLSIIYRRNHFLYRIYPLSSRVNCFDWLGIRFSQSLS